jgi:Protein of unknown function (DUF2950)
MQSRTRTSLKHLQIGALLIGTATCLCGQTAGQKTFSSSNEAMDAFVIAARAGDTNALENILGSGSEAILSSGDAVADNSAREKFLARYAVKHSLAASGHHRFTLNVGSDDWPLPIPLVDNSGKWYFDGAAGKEEILYRRIGHNELSAINVCRGIVAAQKEYAASAHDGKPAGSYAERIVSSPGKEDGLYWGTKSGEPESPAGPLIADASKEGYHASDRPTPYHGYYYQMLKNPAGFAFLAYPAEYRNSGIMTFVVTQKGVIHQKDLGPDTRDVVSHLENYKADGSWESVE